MAVSRERTVWEPRRTCSGVAFVWENMNPLRRGVYPSSPPPPGSGEAMPSGPASRCTPSSSRRRPWLILAGEDHFTLTPDLDRDY
uniref:Uncharacterized protein n=1 Tax=Setaria italica TaxID=4555 RepID=K3ZYK6_SETIT